MAPNTPTCPKCGGEINYHSHAVCIYCGHSFTGEPAQQPMKQSPEVKAAVEAACKNGKWYRLCESLYRKFGNKLGSSAFMHANDEQYIEALTEIGFWPIPTSDAATPSTSELVASETLRMQYLRRLIRDLDNTSPECLSAVDELHILELERDLAAERATVAKLRTACVDSATPFSTNAATSKLHA